jgi:hypothetical protein
MNQNGTGCEMNWINLVQDKFPVALCYEGVNDISCDINA